MQTFSNAGKTENPILPQCENESVQSISREDLAYLAGIIDGEGCIGIYWNKLTSGYKILRVFVSITNNDVEVIKKVSEIYFKLGIKFWYRLKKRKKPNHKITLVISVIGLGNCKKLLDAIYCYLIGKKKEADVLYKFISIRKNKLAISLQNKHSIHEAKYDENEWECLKQIRELKDRSVNPQRLIRKASEILVIG